MEGGSRTTRGAAVYEREMGVNGDVGQASPLGKTPRETDGCWQARTPALLRAAHRQRLAPDTASLLRLMSLDAVRSAAPADAPPHVERPVLPVLLEPARARRTRRHLPELPSGGLGFATRLCLSVLCIGIAGWFAGRGTYASFNAVTSDTASFSTGTLLMDNTGTSACTHVRGGDCGTLQLSSNRNMTSGSVASGTIQITNSGSLPATMSLTASRDTATSSGFDADLNLTIYDNTTGTCIYGHTSLPFSGACDTISGLAGQAANDAFPTNSASRGPLTVPANVPNGNSWQPAEVHTLTVTVELINAAVPANAQGVVNMSWTSTGLPGTSH